GSGFAPGPLPVSCRSRARAGPSPSKAGRVTRSAANPPAGARRMVVMEHPAYSQLRPITESVGVVLCPNPSYSSLEGTNAYIIKAEGDERSIVVDPGPEDEGHLNVLHRYAGDVALILLTHRHGDHADGAHRFRQLTGAPVRAFDERYCSDGAEPLTDGERIVVD